MAQKKVEIEKTEFVLVKLRARSVSLIEEIEEFLKEKCQVLRTSDILQNKDGRDYYVYLTVFPREAQK